MRVARVERFGDPEVLVTGEVPDQAAGPGQVVVAVSVADVLFVETVVRRGEGGEYFPVKPPYVPGGAVAGLVISVGYGVDPSWIGRRVIATTPQGVMPSGPPSRSRSWFRYLTGWACVKRQRWLTTVGPRSACSKPLAPQRGNGCW